MLGNVNPWVPEHVGFGHDVLGVIGMGTKFMEQKWGSNFHAFRTSRSQRLITARGCKASVLVSGSKASLKHDMPALPGKMKQSEQIRPTP